MVDPTELSVILWVDDDASVLEAARTQLRDHFNGRFDIETATSGDEALALIHELIEDQIDIPVVICDEIMPEMRGHKLLAEIHRLLPDTRKVLMTGQAGVEAVVQAVNHADLFHYIAKPWSRMDLTLTVDRAIESHTAILESRRRLRAFHRFVPHRFLELLDVEDPADVVAGLSREVELTVLFTDIRGFSTMSEKAAPGDVFDSLNAVFQSLVPIIEERSGIVDKFIGDAVMALFTDADAALDAAMAMVSAVERLETPMGSVRLGVGVHRGRAVLGTVGTALRMETTAIGDVVNTAARIEGMTRMLGSEVLCSGPTAEIVSTPTRYLGQYRVKGRRETVGFHEPLAIHAAPLRADIEANASLFEAAVQHLDAGGLDPCIDLERYCERVPADPVAHALQSVLERRSARDG